MAATAFLNQLNQRYLSIHRTKEDRFWDTCMGIKVDYDGLSQSETELNQFLSDSSQISDVEQHLLLANDIQDSDEQAKTVTGLQGWLATFKAHSIESAEGKALKADLIAFETELFDKKQNHSLYFTDDNGNKVEGSLPTLASNVRASDNESVRKSSHQAFLDLEQWLLQNGFIELIKRRNQFAKTLGFDNFFDYSVNKKEQMSTEQLFSILD